ncbi:MAG: glycosyltransferase family 2 protein, partial [Candidatus Dadabacteria bacterium]
MGKSLFVHIVTYNHKPYIEKCIHSVLNQEGYLLNENLLLYVTDNNSYDGTAELVSDLFPEVDLTVNEANIGFAAAHNQGFYNFCRSGYEFILVLNPDVVLKRDFLAKFVGAADKNKEFGLYTPKLLRAEESLEPVIPHVFDAAGMVLTHTLRHFDRGSGERDLGQYEESEEVFGGTGACLLIRRECLVDLELRGEKRDRDLYKLKINQALSPNQKTRTCAAK